jgi:hypothetical protein
MLIANTNATARNAIGIAVRQKLLSSNVPTVALRVIMGNFSRQSSVLLCALPCVVVRCHARKRRRSN